jgi:hypothetical protein
MIGRFLNHQGTKDKIVPAVRFGNISVMLELIWNSTVSRPVEMRSRTGFSGSPAAGSRRQLAHSEVCGRPPEAQARIRGARRGASSPRRVSESGHRLVKTRTHGARSNGETAQACDSRGKPRPPDDQKESPAHRQSVAGLRPLISASTSVVRAIMASLPRRVRRCADSRQQTCRSCGLQRCRKILSGPR